SHSILREGRQPQSVRSATMGVLFIPGSGASVRWPVRKRPRVVAESDSGSPLSLLAVRPSGVGTRTFTAARCSDDCKAGTHAAEAGVLVCFREAAPVLHQESCAFGALPRGPSEGWDHEVVAVN